MVGDLDEALEKGRKLLSSSNWVDLKNNNNKLNNDKM